MVLDDLRFRVVTSVAGKLIRLADICIDESERLKPRKDIYTYDPLARAVRDEIIKKEKIFKATPVEFRKKD